MYIQNIPPFMNDANALRAASPNLVFVGVEWCRYCQEAKPIIEDVARALGSAVPVYYVNADKNAHLAKSLGVQTYPTIMYATNDGLYKFSGTRSVNNIVGFVCEHSTGSQSHEFCTARPE